MHLPMKQPTAEQINERLADVEIPPVILAADGGYINGKPGREHYRLLAWLSFQYNYIQIAEIGTHIGLGAIALATNTKNKVITFDIKHREGELPLPENAERKIVYPEYMDEVIKSAIIFYDAKHEGIEEKAFYDELKRRDWRGVLVLDDIHLNDEMREFWKSIDLPKEDWTDVGHHTGTGVVYFFKKMIKHHKPLSFYVEKINTNEPFKFLRFGDGEWYIVKGDPKDIGKGEHQVFPEATEDLRYIVSHLNPKHINGLQGLSLVLANLNNLIPEWNWYNSDVFHQASENGTLRPFFESLKGKNIVIISSGKMRAVKKFIDYADFIEVREQDCYLDKDMVLEKLKQYPTGTIFLFAASRLSVPVIYHSEREDCTMIDIGSLLDPYIGITSRRYHHLLSEDIIRQNLPE